MVVDGGGGEGLVDLASTEGSLLRGVGVSPTLELQVDAGAFGEVGDRFGEVEGLELHNELDGVAAPLAVVGKPILVRNVCEPVVVISTTVVGPSDADSTSWTIDQK